MSNLIVNYTPDTYFIASHSLIKINTSNSLLSGGNNRLTTAFISADLESKQIIEDYFKSSAERKKSLRKLASHRVKSVNTVFQILEWSVKVGVCSAYDAAVDLLAESNDITLEVARHPTLENLISEKKVATLLSGIARARHIPLTERLKIVLQHVQSTKRMVKESIIDALFLFTDEAAEAKTDTVILQIAKSYLLWFASDKQPDKFIQRYAKDIIDELS